MLTLVLVVMGLALLYAYRSQSPALQTVTITQAIQEINSGQVKKVTIVANKATLEFSSGDKQQTNLPERDEVFQKALFDYNNAHPTQTITIDYQQESPTFSVIASILLSLLPLLLIGGFFYYLMRQAQHR